MSALYDCECDSFEMIEEQDTFKMNEGIPGPGVPAGGSAGQILRKKSAESYDTEWDTLDAGEIPYSGSTSYSNNTVGSKVYELDSGVNSLWNYAVQANTKASNALDNETAAYNYHLQYHVGDYCLYQQKIYRCTVETPAAGETWNSSHWTAVTIGDEMIETASELSDVKNAFEENNLIDLTALDGNPTTINVEWMYGYFDPSTEAPAPSTWNIMTKNILHVGRGTTIYVSNGYGFSVHRFNNDGSYIGYTDYNGKYQLTFDSNANIILCGRYVPGQAISDMSDVISNISIKTVSSYSNNEKFTKLSEEQYFDKNEYTLVKPLYESGYIDGSGTKQFNLKNARTIDILPVPKGSIIRTESEIGAALHFYNASGIWQRYQGLSQESHLIISEDSYIRFGMSYQDTREFTDLSLPNQKIHIYIKDTDSRIKAIEAGLLSEGSSTVKYYWEHGYFDPGTQQPVYNSSYNIKTIDIIHLGKGSSISIPSGYAMTIHYFDADGNYLSYEYYTGPKTKDFIYNKNVIVTASTNPAGAISDIDAVANQVTINTVFPVNAECGSNYWQGKKIVWFGTSIPAGVVNAGDSGGNGAYPTRIGEMLGATVYNESVGSSDVRAGTHGQYVTADDPMGYGGVSAPGLMLSLSLSSAEKQDIYDHWSDKWQNIITWYADQVDMTNIQQYKNASWDVKLAKYLTGGSVGQCDLYVFDHGYNDRDRDAQFTELDDVPQDPTDRRYWFGAMAFLFQKIYADNPKAKIVIVGHYSTNQWSGDSSTKYVCEAQGKLAELWSIPIIRTWEHMGFCFVSFTSGGQTIIPAQAWMPDYIHPASDTTGKTLQRYAEVLYPFFRDLR